MEYVVKHSARNDILESYSFGIWDIPPNYYHCNCSLFNLAFGKLKNENEIISIENQ